MQLRLQKSKYFAISQVGNSNVYYRVQLKGDVPCQMLRPLPDFRGGIMPNRSNGPATSGRNEFCGAYSCLRAAPLKVTTLPVALRCMGSVGV